MISRVGSISAVGRGQEALLLVLEVPVEGAPGDAGELDQVGHRGRLVALLGDRRDHRREEPLALVSIRLVTRQCRGLGAAFDPATRLRPPTASASSRRTISGYAGVAQDRSEASDSWYAIGPKQRISTLRDPLAFLIVERRIPIANRALRKISRASGSGSVPKVGARKTALSTQRGAPPGRHMPLASAGPRDGDTRLQKGGRY